MKSLKLKILSGFAIIILLLTFLATYSYISINEYNNDVEKIVQEELELLIMKKKLQYNIASRTALSRGYILFGEEDYKERFNKLTAESIGLQETLLKSDKNSDLEAVIESSKEWRTSITDQVFTNFEEGNQELAIQNLKDLTQLGREVDSAINDVALEQEKEMIKKADALVQSGNQLAEVIISISIAAIISGIIISFVLAQMIVKPILLAVRRVSIVAEGDLSGEDLVTSSKDEVGVLIHSINNMVTNLRVLIKQVNETSYSVAASSEELSASAQQTTQATELITTNIQEVATGAEQQAASIEESTTSIYEMTKGIMQISQSANVTSEQSSHALEKTIEGYTVIEDTIQQMDSVQETITHLADSVNRMGTRSTEIEHIIEVISTISNQTNLLALNAAIEAARAGEHGRGFAVVADEVRKLAEQSSQSAQQITQLIETIKQDIAASMDGMSLGTNEVAKGLEGVQQAGKVFDQIKATIEQVATQSQEVSAATEQLSASAQQVAASMEEISKITEEVSAGTQTVSSSTEEQLASMEEISGFADTLAKMAEELQLSIAKFKL